nr:probable rhamnogalacturonate lyase B [Ipomoea batatas]
MSAKFAYVGLAPPGNAGSWQRDVKGYQFWTQTNKTGYFKIRAVRPGNYNLYAWVPGFLGDYKYNISINITPGDNINVRNLVFYPPRNGPTLWEIGIPDRKASEFFVPDPKPGLVNRVFINRTAEKFRQYGLWDRYTDYYPKHDLVYTVGKSDYTRDWFFAHVNR